MKLPQAVFVGYFPKVTHAGVDWLGNDLVHEICSVSNCFSKGPENWISHWEHNELGFYDSEEIAHKVIEGNPNRFDIYALKLYPFHCLQGKTEEISLQSQLADPTANYEFLGYDIVTKSSSAFFECSPLSCNSGAQEYPVNRFCLISTKEVAIQVLSSICADDNYEPGPYFMFEVYRKLRLN